MYEIQVLIKNLDTNKAFGGKVGDIARDDVMKTLVEITAVIGATLDTREDL